MKKLRSISLLAALGLSLALIVAPTAAYASSATATVKATTQRMSQPTLQSTQHGTYNAGTRVGLVCHERGQSVKGYYSRYIAGGYSNLWYRTSDGHYIADIDIDTGSNSAVAPACGVSIDTNASFKLTFRNSGKVLDIRGGGTANGTAVQQYASNGTKSQIFKLISVGGGYFKITSQLSTSQVMEVGAGRNTNGSKVNTWSGGTAAHQQWRPVYSASGYVNLVPRHAPWLCLDVPGASKDNSVQLQVTACNDTDAQKISLTKVTPAASTPPTITVKTVGSGTCDYVKSGDNYIKSVGKGKLLGAYTVSGWKVAVCGPRPDFDNALVSSAGRGVNPFGLAPTAADLNGYQCTELATRWLYYVHGARITDHGSGGGNGRDIVNNYAAKFPAKFVKYSNAKTNRPVAGDVISFKTSSAAGHVGIIYKVNIDTNGDGNVEVLEQNSARPGGAAGKSSYTVKAWQITDTINWLHRK